MVCEAIAEKFPTLTRLPQAPEYAASVSSYFAAFENEVRPACILQPTTSEEVAAILDFLQEHSVKAKVAIRGGGHTPWAGAANIEAGITIDMQYLKGVKLNRDKTVSIAAGETWGNVYDVLEKSGLAVVGGRVSKVGIVGLTIGGGLSYFSAAAGFVCDNVINFEVVLAGGRIVQANREHNNGLFRALKGGTNNFGIITRIDFPTFEQGKLWGGSLFYAHTTYNTMIAALQDFASAPIPDQHAHIIASTNVSAAGRVNVVNVYYTKPTPCPPSLSPFTALGDQLGNSLREDSLLGFAKEQSSFSTNGARQLYFTTTIKPDKSLMLEMQQLFDDTIDELQSLRGLILSMVFQPLTRVLLEHSAEKGSNSLGIDAADGPLIIVLINSVHADPSDDSRMVQKVEALLGRINDLARRKGQHSSYRFMNYSFKSEPVIECYGTENVDHLQEMSRMYDPEKFFQERVPGGFKLP